ncbi:hypothetical protein [Pseudaestuariivita rosea]|uniref:hypothetical protein n=1 Tax=Pseudaestuariivita rosea TaxID=2763263 RepID=UPI001ABA12DD|nr:hypothetical protein [Pseudaestuariivita rosea]
MTKTPVEIDVYCGTFASQPLVYAHLADITAPGIIDLDHVEVICRTNPAPRLLHFFDQPASNRIEDAMGLNDTCVLVLPGAGVSAEHLKTSPLLTRLFTFIGHRHRAAP